MTWAMNPGLSPLPMNAGAGQRIASFPAPSQPLRSAFFADLDGHVLAARLSDHLEEVENAAIARVECSFMVLTLAEIWA
jgi:hypothetical protein